MKRVVSIIICIALAAPIFAKSKPQKLTVEQKTEPLGVDTPEPRFGWNIQTDQQGYVQSAWQIQVASSREKLQANKADFWDSKKVESHDQQFITYKGKALEAAHTYFWRVKIWSANGEASTWSEPSSFVTGLFNPKAWDQAAWIAYEELPADQMIMPGVHGSGDNLGKRGVNRAIIPQFRKPFEIKGKIHQAFLFISGLGQYEARVNGKKVGDDFLAPGWTNYEKRCLYNTYDVSTQLQQGKNVIGAMVGTGFMYINRERYRKMVRAEGFPMLRAKLLITYEDGTTQEVHTDESWKTSPSPITFSTIYGGEDYDATQEQVGWDNIGFDDASWKKVIPVAGPGGHMFAQRDYSLKVMQEFEVKEKKPINDHQFLVDFGQNASGIIQLKVKGNKGDQIKITPAEVLDDDGLPYQKASGAPYYFEYTLKGGDEEVWAPRFTYYGFRYALVDVKAADSKHLLNTLQLTMQHTRNSSPQVGSFRSSNPLFNQINELINWGIKSNLASVATDCPHREKLGWLEQTHLIGSSLKYNFDIYNLYNKVIDDMIEGQLPNGLVPDIVPEYVPFEGGFRDSPEWGSASIIIPWYLYQWYGDQSVLEKAYPMMKRYFAYLETKASNHILSHGLGDWFDLGPKNPGVSQLTPIALTATATYYYDADLMSQIATALGQTDDANRFKEKATTIKQAFNGKFYQSQTGVYATGSQTSYAMPLYMGIVDATNRKTVEQNLIDSIKAGHLALTAGDVGYRYLLRALEEAGDSQLIYEMNNRDDVPGYGYQLKHGATALTESWPALKYVSNNHMMLGHLMEWLYSGLGGIRQQQNDFGFKHILLEPEMVKGLDDVQASYESINGTIVVHWQKEKQHTRLVVQIPANTDALLLLPVTDAAAIQVDGKPLKGNQYITVAGTQGNKTKLQVKSGTYEITLKNE